MEAGDSGCRGLCEGEGAVGRQGAMSKRQQIFCSTATASRPSSAKCETVCTPFPFLFPALVREGTGSSVHSSVQLGENKWFNKRLEVCNHLNFTSFVLFMISVHNFLTVHPPPLCLSFCYSHSLSPNYRTKQNYFDLYARRAAKAKATVPWRSSSSTCPSRVALLFSFLCASFDCQ